MNGSVPPILEVGTRYAGRGWSVIPVPYRSKNPGFRGWESLRLTEADLPAYFNGKPQNIGVLLGEPSGWLIDVDLDHARAVELAPDFLPPTPAIFGRVGKPNSHWLYCTSGPIATKKFRSKSAEMLLELRSTGMQTIVPPSTHESGEAITWKDPEAEPATVDPDELLESVTRLAETIRIELGEKSARPRKKATQTPAKPRPDTDTPDNRQERCLRAMLRIGLADHNDGSLRLYACACRCVEHDLDDSAAVAVIRDYAGRRPFPRLRRPAAVSAAVVRRGDRPPTAGRRAAMPERAGAGN